MSLTIYEQQDDAVEGQKPLAPCHRCHRRSYYPRREWDLFIRMVISEVEARCAGCGEPVSCCFCPSVRRMDIPA